MSRQTWILLPHPPNIYTQTLLKKIDNHRFTSGVQEYKDLTSFIASFGQKHLSVLGSAHDSVSFGAAQWASVPSRGGTVQQQAGPILERAVSYRNFVCIT